MKVSKYLTGFLIYFSLLLLGNPCVRLYSSQIFTLGKLTILIISFGLLGFRLVSNEYVSKAGISVLGILGFLMFGSLVLNQDYHNIGTYLSYLTYLIVAFLLSQLIAYEDFKNVYITLILSLAVISLIFFMVQYMNPDFVFKLLPCKIIVNVDGAYVSSLFYSTIQEIKFDYIYLVPRNCGIFWEPGVYQGFLNLALVFLLERDPSEEKFFRTKLIIILITLVTTLSATMLIVTGIIVATHFRKIIRLFHPLLVGSALFGIIINGVYFIPIIHSVLLSLQSRVDYGILRRIGIDFLGLDDIIAWFGFGSGFDSQVSFNGYINTFQHFGIYFGIILIVGLMKLSMMNDRNRFVLVLTIILSVTTEPIFISIFFFWLAFYGIDSKLYIREPRLIK